MCVTYIVHYVGTVNLQVVCIIMWLYIQVQKVINPIA